MDTNKVCSYEPNEKFIKWASNLSGISGGNPKGNLWFCGIEYGGNDYNPDFLEEKLDYSNSQNSLPCWDDDVVLKNNQEATKWQYNQKIAKLCCHYEGLDINSYKTYILKDMCRQDKNTFLMNLYPKNFLNTDHRHWKKELFDLTGFPNKTTYLAWCMKYRFPILKDLVKKHKPKCLVCTGISFVNDFELAFLEKEDLFQKGKEKDLPSKKKYKEYYLNDGETKMLVTPFFGQGGIMSDSDLIELSNILKK